MEDQAKAKGLDVRDRSITNVQRLCKAVEPMLHEGNSRKERSTQLNWATVHHILRKRVRNEKEKKRQQQKAMDEAARRWPVKVSTKGTAEEEDESAVVVGSR